MQCTVAGNVQLEQRVGSRGGYCTASQAVKRATDCLSDAAPSAPRPAFPAVTRPRCRRSREISSRAELPRKEPLPVADGSPAVNSFRRGCPNALAGSTAFEKGEDNAKIHALFTRDWRGWVDTVRSALSETREKNRKY